MGYAEELYPNIEWAQTLPGCKLPPGFLPMAVKSLNTYRQAQADGYAAPHDIGLRTPTLKIPADDLTSREVRQAVDALKRATDLGQERTGGRVNGLSANQIKIPLRIAALALGLQSNTDTDRAMTYLANPTITPVANPETGRLETMTVPHGCVNSSLDLWSTIADSRDIVLTGWDVTNPSRPVPFREALTEYPSVIAAHENRHLVGLTSAQWALAMNERQAPQNPDQVINWRPEELRSEFHESFAADQATESWRMKAPVRMVNAIDNGTYLGHYVELGH